jgi:NAD(P)H dehydrogenase (quinone)
MTYGISGASGKLGRIAADTLLAQVPPEQVVLSTRTPEALDDLKARGAQVRYGDFDDVDSLPGAFAGVDRMFMISASNGTGKRDDQHGGAIRAAREAGVRHVVFPSMPSVDKSDHPVGLAAAAYREAEATLKESGLAWTVLRDGPYSELHVVERFASAVAAGRVIMSSGDGKAGFVSRNDVAAAAIAVLRSEEGEHDGETYDISGPELLSFPEAVALVAEVTGREIEYVEVDDEAFAEHLRGNGVPDLMVDALSGMGRAVREGYFAIATDQVRELTGKAPVPLRDVLERNREALLQPAAQ